MKISDIGKISKFKIAQKTYIDKDISKAYTSDLLSDVMANAKADSILITIQAHKNTVAVSTLINSPVIIICNNRAIPKDMIKAAKDEKIAIFKTKLNQYETSVILSTLLNK